MARKISVKKKTTKKPKTKTKKPALAAKSKGAKLKGKIMATKNRRAHRRFTATNLWLRERSGDYQFLVAAANISEGGIFLKGRLKTGKSLSQISIPLGASGENLELSARPLHDRLDVDSCGTGYEFLEVTPAQRKSLRNFLRNLD